MTPELHELETTTLQGTSPDLTEKDMGKIIDSRVPAGRGYVKMTSDDFLRGFEGPMVVITIKLTTKFGRVYVIFSNYQTSKSTLPETNTPGKGDSGWKVSFWGAKMFVLGRLSQWKQFPVSIAPPHNRHNPPKRLLLRTDGQGLLINLIHFWWPSLAKMPGFLKAWVDLDVEVCPGRNGSVKPMVATPRKINGWNLKITQLKRKIIFQTIIFRFHVNLPGCKSPIPGEICPFQYGLLNGLYMVVTNHFN